MAIKALFQHAGLDFWIDMAREMQDQFGWDIPYVVGADASAGEVARKIPGAVFHTNSRAKLALPPVNGPQADFAIPDASLLEAMSLYETVFLKMMDRYDLAGDLSYGQRLFQYHQQVALWKGILDHYKPDVAVFRIAPHMGHDYVLYALCRVLDIRTFMFERTAIPGLVYPVESFEDGSPRLSGRVKDTLAKGQVPFSLSQASQEHLARLEKTYDQALPLHLRYKLKNFKNEGELESIGGTVRTMGKTVARGLLRREKASDIRKALLRNWGPVVRKQLHAHYNELTRPVDFDRPYVFAALQCEPERQTCPCGGVFGNQYLMVEALSRSVPEGWHIYVKEHVSQFKSYQYAERSRTKDFYNYLDSLENVSLVPLNVTSFDLIDNARASATVSGTVAWESLVRGKPAMLFGYSWYRDCPELFVTHTKEQLTEAVSRIQDGFLPDGERVRAFLSVVEDVGVHAIIDKVYAKLDLVNPQENVARLAACLHEAMN